MAKKGIWSSMVEMTASMLKKIVDKQIMTEAKQPKKKDKTKNK